MKKLAIRAFKDDSRTIFIPTAWMQVMKASWGIQRVMICAFLKWSVVFAVIEQDQYMTSAKQP